MKITIEAEPRYEIGYKYTHYSDGRKYTVIGYNFQTLKTRDGEITTVKYITIHDFAQQLLVNNETPESTIARSEMLALV